MAVCYFDLCKDRLLNEVVLMGSHDAAIDSGGSNTQTQTLNIYEQAEDGARFFDLRVAAFKSSTGGGKVELKSYHDATKISSPNFRIDNRMKVGDLGATRSGVKTHANVLGYAGFGLQSMLQQAKQFLTDYGSEFLIFKFDKSENWKLIVEVCQQELFADGFLFQTGNGGADARNLNIKELRQLCGKVLILFPEAAFDELEQVDTLHRQGFLKWKNLYSKSAISAKGYKRYFDGLQYYGKGGVSAGARGDTNKINTNADVQTQLMQGEGKYKVKKPGWKGKIGMTSSGYHVNGGAADRQAIGLMYWTTTGVSRSGIEKRNRKMWTDVVRTDMVNLGLQNADPSIGGMGRGSAGQALKSFMPNIIMVDFVDGQKGDTIYQMNFNSGAVVSQELAGIDDSESE